MNFTLFSMGCDVVGDVSALHSSSPSATLSGCDQRDLSDGDSLQRCEVAAIAAFNRLALHGCEGSLGCFSLTWKISPCASFGQAPPKAR
jgi:hypothetical protein